VVIDTNLEDQMWKKKLLILQILNELSILTKKVLGRDIARQVHGEIPYRLVGTYLDQLEWELYITCHPADTSLWPECLYELTSLGKERVEKSRKPKV
jgi:hypothetical protein